MAEMLREKMVVTRKPHQCWSCLRKFPAGTKMRSWAAAQDGVVYGGYDCDTCRAILETQPHDAWDWEDMGPGFIIGHIDGCGYGGKTPEEFLYIAKNEPNLVGNIIWYGGGISGEARYAGMKLKFMLERGGTRWEVWQDGILLGSATKGSMPGARAAVTVFAWEVAHGVNFSRDETERIATIAGMSIQVLWQVSSGGWRWEFGKPEAYYPVADVLASGYEEDAAEAALRGILAFETWATQQVGESYNT